MSYDLAMLRGAVVGFLQRDRPVLPPSQQAGNLVGLRNLIDLLEVEFSDRAQELAETGYHEADGSVSAVDWVRHNCKMGRGAAADRLKVGEMAPKLQFSAEVLAQGEIGFGHLVLLARTAAKLTLSRTGAGFDETALLGQATTMSVGRFRHECHHAIHAADPEQVVAEEVALVEARSLVVTQHDDRAFTGNFVLDPEGGAIVMSALEPLAKPTGKDDHRSRDKRLGDALVEVCRHRLDQGSLPRDGGVRPHLHLTATLEALRQLPGAAAVEIEHSLPISARALERIACDSTLTRIILGADSTVIDVGRARRVVSPSLRKALVVRDKCCRWPGCERPASMTEAHHIVHWINGGRTVQQNTMLFCHRHHWLLHEGGWQIVVADDDRVLTVPPRSARPPNVAAA